ncbi:MAG: sugar ABC transporter permease, partial [Mesorhizobium sp.]
MLSRRRSMTSSASRYLPFQALGELSETRYWMYLLLLPSLVLILLV